MTLSPNQHTIVVVDDDKNDRLHTRQALMQSCYMVFEAVNGHRLHEILNGFPVDLILLDLRLPGEDGINLITSIRQKTDAPIIIVSGIENIAEKRDTLKSGADDYITKPFYPEELQARIEANLRRYKPSQFIDSSNELYFGSWILDRSIFDVRDDQSIPLGLTMHEYRLLEKLILANGRTLTRDELMEYHNKRGVDVHVTRIRKKFSYSNIIITVRGAGYRLGVPVTHHS